MDDILELLGFKILRKSHQINMVRDEEINSYALKVIGLMKEKIYKLESV